MSFVEAFITLSIPTSIIFGVWVEWTHQHHNHRIDRQHPSLLCYPFLPKPEEEQPDKPEYLSGQIRREP